MNIVNNKKEQGSMVYLDYAATAPVDDRVLEAMLPFLRQSFGNPSSLHSLGREARAAVANARDNVARLIGASPEEIIFTSGGTESDNWLLKNTAQKYFREGKSPHIITSAIEHHAVIESCKYLESLGAIITYLPVDGEGRIDIGDLTAALSADTAIVSLMLANNELGTIEPIADAGKIIREYEVTSGNEIFFHTDAVQAVGHIPVAVADLGVDALSMSGHKLYAPKGIGAAYLKRGRDVGVFFHGGSQERDLRGGTENVPAIIGMGEAARLAANEMAAENERLLKLRAQLLAELASIEKSFVNSPSDDMLAGIINFGIEGVAKDIMLIRLDLMGFAVSAGSACSAGSLDDSHVLTSLGISSEKLAASIRVSLGRFTDEDEVARFLTALKQIAANFE